MPMAVEEQAMHLLKRSAAGQEAMVWVAMSCDRCVPVDSVQHAEVQMAMNSHQLRWFWLCSYWTRAVAAGGEREFTRWFSFTENVWAHAGADPAHSGQIITVYAQINMGVVGNDH